jgi:hypothetical protein
LFPSRPRAAACSIVFAVMTPNATGMPVWMVRVASPVATACEMYRSWSVSPRMTQPSADDPS